MTTPAPKTRSTGEYISFLEQKIAKLENKLNKDSQAFELECKKAEIELLDQRYEKLLSRWKKIQDWYETADRSVHSWAELDKIMEKKN